MTASLRVGLVALIVMAVIITGAVVMVKRQSASSASNSDCITTESQLKNAIDIGGVAKICAPEKCWQTQVKLTEEIDITGKHFSVECSSNLEDGDNCASLPCSIAGVGSHRLFSGSPQSAHFKSISFNFGEADNGGAFQITGGTTNFTDCSFKFNQASGDGGALFVAGSSTEVHLTLANENGYNSAGNRGGFLFATDGADVAIDSNSTVSDVSIVVNTAERYGGFAGAVNGSSVDLRGLELECTNQAQLGGDYLFIGDGASVECERVVFMAPGTHNPDEPIAFNSSVGISGASMSCKSSEESNPSQCKRFVDEK